MKKVISVIITVCFCFLLFAKSVKVITYPAPESEKVLGNNSVFVNGEQIDLYKALSPTRLGGEYYFCYFDFEGEVEVEVKVSHNHPFWWGTPKPRQAEVFPPTIKYTRDGENVKIKADKPFKAIVMQQRYHMPLIIFGNAIEKNKPKPTDKDVIYFGAGTHFLQEPIVLKDNQTLYVEGGAVVKAPVLAKDAKNIKICGRGIISFDNRPRMSSECLEFNNCNGISLNDVIVKDATSWTIVFRNSKNIDVDNLKVCGARMINDDVFDICNSSDITIKNTFARAQDDIIALKGWHGSGKELGRKLTKNLDDRNNNLPVENIYIENCIFWTDSANIFRIGYECDAPYFKNLVCKKLYVPFYSQYRKPRKDFNWSHSIIWLQATHSMPILDMHFEDIYIHSNGRDMVLLTAIPQVVDAPHVKTCGRIENITLKNVVVGGLKSYGGDSFNGEIFIEGKSSTCDVKNVKVENLTYFGEKKTPENLKIHIGDFTSGIDVLGKKK